MLKITFKNVCYLILYSIPNTILSFLILYMINNSIAGNINFLKDYTGWVFIAIVLNTYLLNIIFQKKINQYSYELLYENEKVVFKKILQSPLILLEKLGTQRFYTTVEDLRVFNFLPGVVTHTVNSLLMLLLCMVYLFSLSASGAATIIFLIILLAGVYFLVLNHLSGKLHTLREFNEDYFKYVDDVTKGFKDLKMDLAKRDNLMNKYLIPNRDKAEHLDFNIQYTFLSVNLISQYGLYLVVGVILFLLPEVGLLNREDVISYVVILLFLAGPINILINMQNFYVRISRIRIIW